MSGCSHLAPSGCDTLVALGSATTDNSVILGKNSDRPPNEAQPLVKFPRQEHEPGATVQCTYVEIPQASETYAVIGSQPHWLWGFEHGMNEHGVIIGNEAVWSKDPPRKEESLLGMDLLRLGLERGRSAYEAMHIIIDLLQQYGQGGNCVRAGEFYYHNSFLLADFEEAWVLETSDRRWVAKRVYDGIYTLSNVYTIETEWDEASPDLIDYAVSQGWASRAEPFSFSRAYSYLDMDTLAGCQSRKNRHTALLEEYFGYIDVPLMKEILRDHYEGTVIEPRFNPANAIQMAICMHARKHDDSETAASAVMHLRPWETAPLDRLYWSSLASPCTSVYVPFFLDLDLPRELGQGTHIYDPDSPWWIYEKLQRLTSKNYDLLAPPVRALWESLEEQFRNHLAQYENRARALLTRGDVSEARRLLQGFSEWCHESTLQQAKRALELTRELEHATPTPADLNYPFTRERDEAAGLDLESSD